MNKLETIARNKNANTLNRYKAAKAIVGTKPYLQKLINQWVYGAFLNYKINASGKIRRIMNGNKNGLNEYVNSAAIINNTLKHRPTGRGAPPQTTNNNALWRGLNKVPSSVHSGYLQNKSVSSWSGLKNTAKAFSLFGKNGLLLKLPKNKMKNTPYVSFQPGESPVYYNLNNQEFEFILPPSVFILTKPNKNGVVEVINIRHKNNTPRFRKVAMKWKRKVRK